MGLGVVVAALVVASVALLWSWLQRRSLARRLAAVTARLDGSMPAARRLEAVLLALEAAAQRLVETADHAASARERLADVLRAIPQGVLVCDERGQPVLRTGLVDELASGRHADLLAARQIEELLRLALGGRRERRTLELFGPPRRVLAVEAFPLDDGQRTVGAAAVVEDVSERRRLEAVRRDFVANISHELKTPIGALALLAETMAGEPDAEVIRRLAGRLQEEAHRVARIIEDLLDLSRIEAEETPRREPVPVHLIVAEAVERVRPAAEVHGVSLDVAEPSHRLVVAGDRRQLVSALFNLLENAVKYSEPGGRVELRAGTDGSRVELAVRDHGIGIPARDLERIFERFYRVDRARSRQTGGTGLGLAIVRHVATNHGGEVTVASREGEGSLFRLVLPLAGGPVAVSSAS
jgi:two-component system sensor histidine kinase SenX3